MQLRLALYSDVAVFLWFVLVERFRDHVLTFSGSCKQLSNVEDPADVHMPKPNFGSLAAHGGCSLEPFVLHQRPALLDNISTSAFCSKGTLSPNQPSSNEPAGFESESPAAHFAAIGTHAL